MAVVLEYSEYSGGLGSRTSAAAPRWPPAAATGTGVTSVACASAEMFDNLIGHAGTAFQKYSEKYSKIRAYSSQSIPSLCLNKLSNNDVDTP